MMKKSFALFVCLLWLITGIFAQEVSKSDAHDAASTWLKNRQEVDRHLLPEVQTIINDHGKTLAYCFALHPHGYLVLSADLSLPPVMAYSFENDLALNDEHPNPLEDMLIRDIDSRLANVSLIPEKTIENNRRQWYALNTESMQTRVFEQWPPAGSTSTGGWLETNWSQSAPYNNFCPMDEVTSQRSVAGCPAVALAMILHFQKNLNGTQFTDDDDYYHSYSGRQYWIDDDSHEMDFPPFPELNEYFDSMAYKFESYIPLNTDEIAALVFSCGVAAHQVYTSSVSGTFGVNQAYDAYMRFGYSGAKLVYDSDTSFYTQMKHNMMDGIPVHLAVLSNTGSGGHNVVTDGYNTDNYYHLNFGWGGSYNGWYLLPDEIPYNLTIIEGAVLDIGDTHVGIEGPQTSEIPDCSIFPNPSKGEVNIRLDLKKNSFTSINLKDINGRQLQDLFSGHLEKGMNKIHAYIKIPDGIYIIQIEFEQSKQSKKLIINH